MQYFFDIFDGDGWAQDDLGVDCDDDRGARHQAVLALNELAGELLPADGPSKTLIIRVRRGAEHAFTVSMVFATTAGPGLVDLSIAD